jgi:hypothetical protein
MKTSPQSNVVLFSSHIQRILQIPSEEAPFPGLVEYLEEFKKFIQTPHSTESTSQFVLFHAAKFGDIKKELAIIAISNFYYKTDKIEESLALSVAYAKNLGLSEYQFNTMIDLLNEKAKLGEDVQKVFLGNNFPKEEKKLLAVIFGQTIEMVHFVPSFHDLLRGMLKASLEECTDCTKCPDRKKCEKLDPGGEIIPHEFGPTLQ